MALQITITNKNTDITYPDTYHVIKAVVIDIKNTFAEMYVEIYKNAIARNADKSPIRWHSGQHIIITCPSSDYDNFFSLSELNKTNNNVFSQAYAFLKTQDPDVLNYMGDCLFDYKNDSTDV